MEKQLFGIEMIYEITLDFRRSEFLCLGRQLKKILNCYALKDMYWMVKDIDIVYFDKEKIEDKILNHKKIGNLVLDNEQMRAGIFLGSKNSSDLKKYEKKIRYRSLGRRTRC